MNLCQIQFTCTLSLFNRRMQAQNSISGARIFAWVLFTLFSCLLSIRVVNNPAWEQASKALEGTAEANSASRFRGLQTASACSCCNSGGAGASNPGDVTPLSSIVVARSGYEDLGGSLSASSTQEAIGVVEKLQCCNVTSSDHTTGVFTCEDDGDGTSENCRGDRVAFFRGGELLVARQQHSWLAAHPVLNLFQGA